MSKAAVNAGPRWILEPYKAALVRVRIKSWIEEIVRGELYLYINAEDEDRYLCWVRSF